MLKARRTLQNVKRGYATRGAKLNYRKYKMRTNPAPKTIGGVIKAAIPVAVSLYGARFVTNYLSTLGPVANITGRLGSFARPAVAGITLVGAHFATKKGPTALKKHRASIMVGTGINLIDSLIGAFAPESVKSMFGLGDHGMYSQMGDYVTVDDYVTVGDAPPIDDDIALADYVTVGQVEEELGMLEAELGAEEDLGDALSRPLLGGVSQSAMLAPVRPKSMVAPVPARSFTKRVAHAGGGYDKPDVLYTGIFGGGF